MTREKMKRNLVVILFRETLCTTEVVAPPQPYSVKQEKKHRIPVLKAFHYNPANLCLSEVLERLYVGDCHSNPAFNPSTSDYPPKAVVSGLTRELRHIKIVMGSFKEENGCSFEIGMKSILPMTIYLYGCGQIRHAFYNSPQSCYKWQNCTSSGMAF